MPALAALVGLVVGSFLNVVVHRLPRKQSLVRPSSSCPACGVALRARDNVPVLSWLWLRGRCPACSARISWRYPAIELATGALFAGLVARISDPERAVFACAAAAVFVAIAFIDLEHRKVPNRIVLPATAVAAAWTLGAELARGHPRTAIVSVVCGAAAFGLLFVIAVVSGGMGFGDVKLAGFIGLVTGRFGWEVTLLGLFAGFAAGGVVAAALLVSGRRSRKDAVPFAPMLCAGALIALFAGPGPVRAWIGLQSGVVSF